MNSQTETKLIKSVRSPLLDVLAYLAAVLECLPVETNHLTREWREQRISALVRYRKVLELMPQPTNQWTSAQLIHPPAIDVDVDQQFKEALTAKLAAKGKKLSGDPMANVTIPLEDGEILEIPVVFLREPK